MLTAADGSEDGLGDLFASQPDYWELSGDSAGELFPVAEGCEAVVAHDAGGRLVAFAELLKAHPVSGHPWIGLLVVDGRLRGRGYGRAVAAAVEERFRIAGRTAVELAVLENNPGAVAFWESVGYVEFDRRPDVDRHRPCIVMRKAL
ncbi:hypothetical protein GCM10010468_68410 [Actinocorallia longicatena]|uniref:N-acetyltransferase domain-containing protein n=1 Tax=Actinocorallia longicatena TaxID=111803 RepID=A0ABP6QKK5_9ACTN